MRLIAIGILWLVSTEVTLAGDREVCADTMQSAAAVSACGRLLANPKIATTREITEFRLNRAFAELELYELDAALSDIKSAETNIDNRDKYRLNLVYGNYWSARGDSEKAVTYYDDAARIDPSGASAFGNLCRRYIALKNFDRALVNCNEQVKLSPLEAEPYATRARIYLGLKLFELALKDLDRSISLKPSAYGYVVRSSYHEEKGDIASAMLDATAAIRTEPERWQGHWRRARLRYNAKSLDGAISDIEAAARLSPKRPGIVSLKSQIYLDSGKPELAIKALDALLIESPSDATAYRARGYARSNLGLYDQAQDDFSKSLIHDPANYYSILWEYISAYRSGVGGSVWIVALKIRYDRIKDKDKWPAPIIAFMLDLISEKQLRDKAGQAKEVGEGEFYLGMLDVIRQNNEKAKIALERSLTLLPKSYVEYSAANSELKRLRALPR